MVRVRTSPFPRDSGLTPSRAPAEGRQHDDARRRSREKVCPDPQHRGGSDRLHRHCRHHQDAVGLLECVGSRSFECRRSGVDGARAETAWPAWWMNGPDWPDGGEMYVRSSSTGHASRPASDRRRSLLGVDLSPTLIFAGGLCLAPASQRRPGRRPRRLGEPDHAPYERQRLQTDRERRRDRDARARQVRASLLPSRPPTRPLLTCSPSPLSQQRLQRQSQRQPGLLVRRDGRQLVRRGVQPRRRRRLRHVLHDRRHRAVVLEPP